MISLNSQNVRFFYSCSLFKERERRSAFLLGLFSFAHLLTVVLDEHYLFTRKSENLGSKCLVTTVACPTSVVSFAK